MPAGRELPMVTSLIAMGSNLGDRRATLESAWRDLDQASGILIVRTSKIYETAPLGGPEQGAFLNAVLAANVELDAAELLRLLQGIEARFQRRREVRFGPRTLDLDILTYGDKVVVTPDLEIPHPRLHERRFVLVPLADVAPDWRHPIRHETTLEMLAALPVQAGDVRVFAASLGEAS
jgi:2-amino-4-hydroxy-6-hydroxymethyldihydropteridine diphosphokinase